MMAMNKLPIHGVMVLGQKSRSFYRIDDTGDEATDWVSGNEWHDAVRGGSVAPEQVRISDQEHGEE